MELYLDAKVIGKGPKGRTACGSAAYRSCDKIKDNTGRVHNYRHKGGYVTGGVELPAGASAELKNRQTLWQRHESKDIRKDAELFREITVALPNELDYEASASVIRQLAKPLTDRGMCVQWDIHDTTKEGQRNLHAHLMVTMRTLQPDGTFGNKNRSWNKYNGGLNIADLLRPEAARLMNEELAKIGSSERVEHESYAKRGIDKIPTKHMGVAATAMERKGIETNKGNQNRYIDFLNKIHADNLRQVESQTKSGNLEDLISGARAQQDGTETFKDWDALFAMVRDTRRGRSALINELGKLNKVISAYEQGNESYLKWAGCELDNEIQRSWLEQAADETRMKIKQLDVLENLLLDSKELYKAHNKAIYTANKVFWDQYQIDRNKYWMKSCLQRLHSLDGYLSYLRSTISLFDIIFETAEGKKYLELQRKSWEIQANYAKARAELKQQKKDLKEHKKDARHAQRDEKKVVQEKKNLKREDPDDR